MRHVLRIAAIAAIVLLIGRLPVAGQATGTGDGSKTGDGTTPFTGLGQAPEANLFLGSAATKIALEVPPGRGSMTPQLALNYSSGGGPSPYGYGWDLSVPRLQRTTKHGVLSCKDTTFRTEMVLTMAGTSIECTLGSDGVCRPHVESGFIRIKGNNSDLTESNLTEFKVTDKNGITYTFGGPGAVTTSWGLNATFSSTEVAATGSTTTNGFIPGVGTGPCSYISMWALRRVEDPNGNYMEYRYVRDGGMLYPHSIVYGAHPSGPTLHLFTVYFSWETRSDTPLAPSASPVVDDLGFNGLGGYAATMNYRLRRINVIYGTDPATGALVRGYNFNYDTNRKGRQTFLESVTLLGDNGYALTRGDSTVASTIYLYHETTDTTAGFETVSQTATRPVFAYQPNRMRITEDAGVRRDVMDLNGDGYPDLINADIDNNCTVGGYRYWSVYFGSPSGFSTEEKKWYLPVDAVGRCQIQGVEVGYSTVDHTRFTTVDITGDGIPDFVDGLVITDGAGNNWWTV